MASTRDLAVKIFGDSTDINQAFGQAGDGADGMGQRFDGLKTKALGAGVAIGAGVKVAKDFADAASNLSEAQSKSNVIFGDANDQIAALSKTATQDLGLSKREVFDYASSFGGLLKSTGLGEAAFADMSTELTALTADLGSFNNLANEDVAAKLVAGLGGEAEGLKALNIFINEAAVSAKALELGLGDVNGELTEQEKIQARYALIIEQSSDAQGDFARTSEGLANSQKILGAEWENLQAQVGEKLAPMFASLFGYITENIPKVVEWLGPKMTEASEMFGAWWDENGPGIVEAFGNIWAAIEKLWEIAKPILLDNVLPAIEEIGKVMTSAINLVVDLINGDWSAAFSELGNIVSGIFGAIGALFDGLPGWFLQIGKDIVRSLWDGFLELWKPFWDDVVGKVEGLINIVPFLDVDLDGSNSDLVGRTSSGDSTSSSRLSPNQQPTVTINQYITALDAQVAAEAAREAVRTGGEAALLPTGGFG